MDNSPTKVLLIEDNSQDFLMLRMMMADVKGATFDVVNVKLLSDGLAELEKTSFHIVLLDLSLKGSKGLDGLLQVQAKAPHIPVVILTGSEDQAMAFEAVKKGAQDFLVKGKLDANLLSRVIHYAVERHRVMEEMRQKNEELQRLNSLKSEFVSTVSHELRTPLTVILSATNNLLDGAFGDVSDPQKKWLKKINHHSLRLHEMISDILDLSKLQSGKAEMRRESLDLGKLIKTTVANLQTLVKEKKLSLSHRMPAELPHIWADPSRLEQVLTNLITNAIKFTPVEGRVEVSALPEDNHLIVSVSDTGPGIAPEYRDVIFDRFRQVRDSDKQESSTQGIGLGLAICKEIVAQHHGHIWVESELGKGSQFMFQLPIDARDSHQQVKNILVVDDDEEIGELLEVTLTQAGYLVTVLRNGKQAIQCLQDKNKHFDVVFLDLMLPGASGAEVIKVIRQMKMSCEIAVVTAYPNSEMLFEGMATGPLTIIAKPFNTESILDIAAKARPAPSASVPKSRAA